MQERLKPAAALSLAGYAVGLPLTFLVLLVKHRQSILADQALKVSGQGGTEATNPYFHVRMQFQELYRCGGRGTPLLCGWEPSKPWSLLRKARWLRELCSPPTPTPTPHTPRTQKYPCLPSLFRPELFWWRLVLVARKFCIVGVALMFSSTPLFQAW